MPTGKSADCQTLKTTSERRKLLSEKNCFNCTKPKHRAADYRSSKTFLICKNKHHSSICDKSSSTSAERLLTATENNVIYPVAIAKSLRRPFRLFENKPNQKRNKKNLRFILSKYKT